MMRKLLFFAALCMSVNSLLSQQLYLETGKTIASFDYENSFGETLENLNSTNHTYLTLGYRKSVWTKRLFLNLNASYNGYGAIGSDRALDNYFEWDLSYLGANLAFDYEFYKPGNFTFFVKVGASAEFLIQGTQTLNNQVYNAFDEDDFKSGIYFFKGGLGVQYKVSENLSVFNQYMYGFSKAFKVEQGDLSIKTHNFGIGLLINVSKNKASLQSENNEDLQELRIELESNTRKLEELEAKANRIALLEEENKAINVELSQKDNEIEALKASIYNALYPSKGSEFQVEDREDKVYITLKNDLLFNSGSSKLNDEGIQAINDLGEVLAKNPEVAVLVEGHTDNVPFKDSNITNRDLSLRRSKAIVDILSKNKNINPKNLVAAGIGEFDPIADNTTEEGRAKNRRIEIILTPKLSELINIIKN